MADYKAGGTPRLKGPGPSFVAGTPPVQTRQEFISKYRNLLEKSRERVRKDRIKDKRLRR